VPVKTRWCRVLRCGVCSPGLLSCYARRDRPRVRAPFRPPPPSAGADARAPRQVVAAAHAVVLASGTLAPVAALRRALFPGAPPAAVRAFACGHVVPRQRLLALALGRGPGGRELDLRAERRGAPGALDELGRLLLNVCQAVPQARPRAGRGAGPGWALPALAGRCGCGLQCDGRASRRAGPPGCRERARPCCKRGSRDWSAGLGGITWPVCTQIMPGGHDRLLGPRFVLTATQN